MIKKSLQAYNTSSQLIFFVLAHGEGVGGLCLQGGKHQVNRIFELLVILSKLHRVNELNESGEILLLHRSFIMDIPNKGAIQ